MKWLLFFLFASSSALAYTPPLGIPAPPFGIDEVAGAYTYYIDNTSGAATDTSNPNGSPTTPRLTIPTTLPAGAVVEVHGGPYDASVGTNFKPDIGGWAGTSSAPIFIRGVDAAHVATISNLTAAYNFIFGCTYVVFENLKFYNSHVEVRQTSNHLSFRFCEITGVVENPTPGTKNGNIFALWSDSSGTVDQFEDYIVMYKCTVHNNAWPPSYENGAQGVMIQNGARNVWILENQIYNNGEDNIQIYWQANRGTLSAQSVYIGGNTIYDTSGQMENAVDIKQSNDVIVSSNECYGYHNTYASDGSAVIYNNDDPSNNLWLINNYIHDSAIGFRTQESNTGYVIGNLFVNIAHDTGLIYVGISGPGSAIYVRQTVFNGHPEYTLTTYIVNNTIYHADKGITVANTTRVYAQNNIVADLNYTDGTTYHMSKNVGLWTVANNMLYSSGTAPIIHQSSNFSVATFDAGGYGSGDLSGDPLFMNVPGVDFRLQTTSPARDSGIVPDVYATFQTLYGLSIAKDRNAVARPQNTTWDIGAFEYSSAATGKIINLLGIGLAFGNVPIGSSTTGTLRITNTGDTTLTVSSITYPTSFTGAYAGTIASGTSHDVTVTFAPLTIADFAGTITVNSDKTSGTNTIAVTGMGVAASTNSARDPKLGRVICLMRRP